LRDACSELGIRRVPDLLYGARVRTRDSDHGAISGWATCRGRRIRHRSLCTSPCRRLRELNASSCDVLSCFRNSWRSRLRAFRLGDGAELLFDFIDTHVSLLRPVGDLAVETLVVERRGQVAGDVMDNLVQVVRFEAQLAR